ncbi:MAG: hypothetical protein HY553_17895 [Elusimicrobia bacterium]|nr:hypothetical protein [Elusimicrobiota bacterium]
MRSERGVVLVHVMILITLMAWLASMFLSSVLSRQINAKQSMKSSEVRAAMNAAAARITSCLASVGFPVGTTCASALPVSQEAAFQACHGGTSPTEFTIADTDSLAVRPVTFAICATPANPPCRFRINVCEPGDTCPAPTCP